jgi:hypothetical protein
MVSKVSKCKDYLDLIPEPNSLDILKVAKKVGCSERTAWTAYSKLKKERDKLTIFFRIMVENTAKMIKMRSMIGTVFKASRELTYSETKFLDEVDKYIEDKREEMGLDMDGKPYPPE